MNIGTLATIFFMPFLFAIAIIGVVRIINRIYTVFVEGDTANPIETIVFVMLVASLLLIATVHT